MNKLNPGSVVIVSFVIILCLIFFIFLFDSNPEFSEIFNNITVGVGTLLMGAGAIFAAREWIVRPKREFELIKNTYPRKRLKYPGNTKGDFELLRTQSHGRIYLRDLRNNANIVRWIKNWATIEELGYNKGDWNEISDSDIDKYEQGDPIFTPDS